MKVDELMKGVVEGKLSGMSRREEHILVEVECEFWSARGKW